METFTPGKEPDLSKYDWERALDEVQDPISLIDADFRIIKANKAFISKFGSGQEDLTGDRCVELVHPVTGIPEHCPYATDEASHLNNRNEVNGRTSGEVFDITTVPLYDKEGKLSCSIHFARDITLRKRKEQLMEVNLAIGEYALTHTLEEILVMTIDKAEMLTYSQVGFFHFLENQEEVSLQAWSTNTMKSNCKTGDMLSHYPVEEAGVWVDCYHQKKPVIHNDYESLPHRKGMPEGHVKVKRELTIPVIRDEKVVAILGVGNKPVDYNQDDVDLLLHLTNLAYEYILRKKFEEALHDSEQYATALLDAIPDMIFRMNREGVYIDYKAAKDDLHHQANSLIGQNNRDITPPNFADLLEEKITQTLAADSMIIFEYQLPIPGKGIRDYEARMVPSGPDEITAIARDITDRKAAEMALKKKIEELEWINHMMIDREMRMIELKKEINTLLLKTGESEKYIIHK